MWVRTAAIRPVPLHAELPLEELQRVESWISSEDDPVEPRLNELFERFENEQPALAEHVGESFGDSPDQVAIALGYFLATVIWLAFEWKFGKRLQRLEEQDLISVTELLSLDQQLRGADPWEALETDDIVAMEQPHLVKFVQDHVDAALEAHAKDVDVDAVDSIYRVLLVEILALSYAVSAPEGRTHHTAEMHA